MKHIFYLLDGFSPMGLKNQFSKIYKEKFKKKNFLYRLSEKSIFFKNCYGYGETYSTTYSMVNGKNIYENYCDSPEIFLSFKKHNSLHDFYKSQNFKTIYFRNVKPHYPMNGFYNRFNNSFAKEFDKFCLRKKSLNYDFKNFLVSNNYFKKYSEKFNIFYFIHDMSFHDNKKIYDGSIKEHYTAFEKASKTVEKNLRLINYNETKDTLFFLSDHGLSSKPFNRIHTSKKINPEEYENYYKSMFVDEKIKFLFFIVSPKIRKKVITNYVKASDVFEIIKNYNKNKFHAFFQTIKKRLDKKIIISLKNAKGSIYGNTLLNNIFHFHFIKINSHGKYIYSHKHKNNYLFEKDNLIKIINVNKIDNEFKNIIKNYYNFKNFFIKSFLFFLSFIITLPIKILGKIKNL